jgi:hypothetical protein
MGRCKNCSQILFFIALMVAFIGGVITSIRTMDRLGGEFFLRVSGWSLLLSTLYFGMDAFDRSGEENLSKTELDVAFTGLSVPISTFLSNLALPFVMLTLLEFVIVELYLEVEIDLDSADRVNLYILVPFAYLILSSLSIYGRVYDPIVRWSAFPLVLYYLTAFVYENWDNVGTSRGIYSQIGVADKKHFWFRIGEVTPDDGQAGTFIAFAASYAAISAAVILFWSRIVSHWLPKRDLSVASLGRRAGFRTNEAGGV